MCRKWRRAAALGVTVLLGCMVPMSTMLAAEDDVKTEVDSVSNNDMSDEDVDLMQTAGALNVEGTEPNVVPNAEKTSESMDAPEIVIKRDGVNKACSLGGEIVFEYTNNSWGATFEVSVNSSDQEISLFYCQNKVTDMKAEAKTEEQMDSLYWLEETSPVSISPLNDGCYVIYVKVIAGAKTYYARSSGIVVDTVKPVIKGVEAGKSYSEGTLFQVEDANLDYVLVNEQPAALENGSYKVAANGTSCVIRAKDKAGNEETCSIIVLGNDKPGEDTPGEDKPGGDTPGEDKPGEDTPGEDTPGEDKPGEDTPETDNVISRSGEYALKAGVKYHLAEGKWRLAGDKSVYQGGNDFYVNADGNYTFSK